MSLHGNMEGATAKLLLRCKAVLRRIFRETCSREKSGEECRSSPVATSGPDKCFFRRAIAGQNSAYKFGTNEKLAAKRRVFLLP